MLDQYNVLKTKLDLSLKSNAKLTEDLKLQQKTTEELKRENIVATKTIKDLSSQISILLLFSEKMRAQIHSLDPYFDLSEYSDYKVAASKIKLQGKDQNLFSNIQDLQDKNKYLLNRLNTMHLNETSQISPVEFSELNNKLSLCKIEINEKETIIENLQEKIKKLQTLEDVKHLLITKTKGLERTGSANKEQDYSNQEIKNAKFYEKHQKSLEDNMLLRKELKRVKTDLLKALFDNKNFKAISEKQEERIKATEEAENLIKEKLAIKEREIQKLFNEKQSLSEEIFQLKSDSTKLRAKILELEKRLSFVEESKKAFEDALNQTMSERKKYFEAFLQGQREISENMMQHKAELKNLRRESQNFLQEKTKLKEEFMGKEQKWTEERMKFKGKIENQEVMLIQLNKKNQLNMQIITEQNQQILELNQKITQNFSLNMLEEGVFSGFVHITQQKSVNFEEIKENLENQKNCYECLITKMTEKLGVLEQENLDLQENVKSLQATNEELQEKLQETFTKMQDMEKDDENPRINPEELEILNEEKEGFQKEIQDLNEKLQDLQKTKSDLQSSLNKTLDQLTQTSEENSKLLEELKEKERRLEFERCVTQIKEILIQEQHELFKAQLLEISERIEEKIKENQNLVERLQGKEEERKDSQMEIEENPKEKTTEREEILKLREIIAQLELKLQEKIKEEFIYKTQTNNLKKQLDIKIQEVFIGKGKEVF